MSSHKNARLTLHCRAELARRAVEGGQSIAQVASAFRVCTKTARKWVKRFRQFGAEGLADLSSRPHRLHRPISQSIIDEIIALRRQRFAGQHIAKVTGVSSASVSRILRRAGLSRIRDLERAEPVRCYEYRKPG